MKLSSFGTLDAVNTYKTSEVVENKYLRELLMPLL